MTTTPFRLAGQFLGMLEKHVQKSEQVTDAMRKQLAEQAAYTAKMADANLENMFWSTRATRAERVTRVKNLPCHADSCDARFIGFRADGSSIDHKCTCGLGLRKAPLRKIYRIEKAANKSAWYEILSCGHRGEHVFGPNRMYIALAGMPKARRCQECAKEGRK